MVHYSITAWSGKDQGTAPVRQMHTNNSKSPCLYCHFLLTLIALIKKRNCGGFPTAFFGAFEYFLSALLFTTDAFWSFWRAAIPLSSTAGLSRLVLLGCVHLDKFFYLSDFFFPFLPFLNVFPWLIFIWPFPMAYTRGGDGSFRPPPPPFGTYVRN